MARPAQKSAREANDAANQKNGNHNANPKSNEPELGTGGPKPRSAAGESDNEFEAFQNQQFGALKAVLAKRPADDAPLEIANEFSTLWLPLLALDDELLAPAMRDAKNDGEKSKAAFVRKDIVNLLVADLIHEERTTAARVKLEALSDAFEAYEKATTEEREGLGEKAGDLGRTMKDRLERLTGRFRDLDQAQGEAMDLLAPRSLSLFPQRQRSRREVDMPRDSSNTPDRDDRGRFMSDDDRGQSRGGGRGRGGPERDESGRFMSEDRGSRSRYDDDDNGSRRSSSRSRDDDYESDRRYASRSRDDDDRGGGRRTGGWFGDREGHSEASRHGWERSDHGDSGWFGDSRGHSEASRRGWQRSDHGDSGWYGDPEGHSEAARRGWEEGHRSQRREDDDDDYRRGRSRRDEKDYRSRSRDDEDRRYESRRGRSDDDDDRRSSSRSRGHGGWSGDPEGHSEASRRGWENRR